MSSVALVNSPGPSINAIWQFWHHKLQKYIIYIVPNWFTLFTMALEGLFYFWSCTTTFHLSQMAFAHKASVNCHAVIYPALTFSLLQLQTDSHRWNPNYSANERVFQNYIRSRILKETEANLPLFLEMSLPKPYKDSEYHRRSLWVSNLQKI